MSKLFVLRSELVAESPTAPVHVYSQFNDELEVPIDLFGPNLTMITVLDSNVFTNKNAAATVLPVLRDGWRNDYQRTVNAEANRRIVKVFPDFKQRNYTAQYQTYITNYGYDSTTWPPAAKTFKAEYDRGWNYVNAVRSTSNTFGAMPLDPTADNIWPTEITPIA